MKRVLKGELARNLTSSDGADSTTGSDDNPWYLPVVVGPFVDEGTPAVGAGNDCVAPAAALLDARQESRTHFVVFLKPFTDDAVNGDDELFDRTNRSTRPSGGGGGARHSENVYLISSPPVVSNKQAIKTVSAYNCHKCGKPTNRARSTMRYAKHTSRCESPPPEFCKKENVFFSQCLGGCRSFMIRVRVVL